jgi:hypothetical protein
MELTPLSLGVEAIRLTSESVLTASPAHCLHCLHYLHHIHHRIDEHPQLSAHMPAGRKLQVQRHRLKLSVIEQRHQFAAAQYEVHVFIDQVHPDYS